jgi:hypothetical protein
MTAYLQAGDKIHLAFTMDPSGTRETHLVAAQLTEQYRQWGVSVTHWSASTGVGAPHVVSVVREGCSCERQGC